MLTTVPQPKETCHSSSSLLDEKRAPSGKSVPPFLHSHGDDDVVAKKADVDAESAISTIPCDKEPFGQGTCMHRYGNSL